MRTQKEDLENLLEDDRWIQFREWDIDFRRIVDEQNRGILDSEAPEELSLAAMRSLTSRFQLLGRYLIGCPVGAAATDRGPIRERQRRR